ncbi:MAG: alpha/beta hydrolase, partial [Betaproteobacteria bacterium]
MHTFSAPWWLPGGHAQTIWPAKLARHTPGGRPGPQRLRWRRERWPTP